MEITCLIIDDEPLARDRLLSLIQETSELNCIGESKTGKEAIKMIELLLPDLIFLDIKMKDMTGFDVLRMLNCDKKPVVIFVTAFDEFALKAFDYSAFDYLLKPFKKDRFNKAVRQAIQFLKKEKRPKFDENVNRLLSYLDSSENKIEKNSVQGKIPIKVGRSISFLDVSTIKYIQASGSYIDIHTSDKVHVLRSSLNDVLNSINKSNFKRIHRSTVINMEYINKLIYSNYGEIDVQMRDDRLLRISNSYKKDILNALGL